MRAWAGASGRAARRCRRRARCPRSPPRSAAPAAHISPPAAQCVRLRARTRPGRHGGAPSCAGASGAAGYGKGAGATGLSGQVPLCVCVGHRGLQRGAVGPGAAPSASAAHRCHPQTSGRQEAPAHRRRAGPAPCGLRLAAGAWCTSFATPTAPDRMSWYLQRTDLTAGKGAPSQRLSWPAKDHCMRVAALVHICCCRGHSTRTLASGRPLQQQAGPRSAQCA